MKKLYLSLWVVVIGLLFTSIVFADHNSLIPGHDPDRGYTKEKCLEKVVPSYVKDLEGVLDEPKWLGHNVGCLVPEIDHYILVMEYMFLYFSHTDGMALSDMYDEVGDNLRIKIDPMDKEKPKGIKM